MDLNGDTLRIYLHGLNVGGCLFAYFSYFERPFTLRLRASFALFIFFEIIGPMIGLI